MLLEFLAQFTNDNHEQKFKQAIFTFYPSLTGPMHISYLSEFQCNQVLVLGGRDIGQLISTKLSWCLWITFRCIHLQKNMMSFKTLKMKRAIKTYCDLYSHTACYCHCNNSQFADNIFFWMFLQRNRQFLFYSVNMHFQHSIVEKLFQIFKIMQDN